jgi:hypothetical protein
MSMNFHISGTREITVNKTGKVLLQHINYNCWQTPTAVTNKILASDSPVESYKAWVMEKSEDEIELVYADSDIFCEEAPVDSKIVNCGKDECDQLDSWISAVLAEGYELDFYTL